MRAAVSGERDDVQRIEAGGKRDAQAEAMAALEIGDMPVDEHRAHGRGPFDDAGDLDLGPVDLGSAARRRRPGDDDGVERLRCRRVAGEDRHLRIGSDHPGGLYLPLHFRLLLQGLGKGADRDTHAVLDGGCQLEGEDAVVLLAATSVIDADLPGFGIADARIEYGKIARVAAERQRRPRRLFFLLGADIDFPELSGFGRKLAFGQTGQRRAARIERHRHVRAAIAQRRHEVAQIMRGKDLRPAVFVQDEQDARILQLLEIERSLAHEDGPAFFAWRGIIAGVGPPLVCGDPLDRGNIRQGEAVQLFRCNLREEPAHHRLRYPRMSTKMEIDPVTAGRRCGNLFEGRGDAPARRRISQEPVHIAGIDIARLKGSREQIDVIRRTRQIGKRLTCFGRADQDRVGGRRPPGYTLRRRDVSRLVVDKRLEYAREGLG